MLDLVNGSGVGSVLPAYRPCTTPRNGEYRVVYTGDDQCRDRSEV